MKIPEQPLWPDPSRKIPSVFLARPMLHPIVYRKRIQRIEGSPKLGDWVAVYHTDGETEPKVFAYGLFNDRSEIAVRLVRWWGVLPDEEFWKQQLTQALSLRRECLSLDATTNAYRIIHSEADGFPGLVIDRYDNVLSAEVFSIGMYQRATQIIDRLSVMCGTQHYLIQANPYFASQEGFEVPNLTSPELPGSVTITESGTRFRVHFESGHKTGFFCDQRDNRQRLAELCRGKSVLDLCCYTGGFSVHAAKAGGAHEVTGVDLDEVPLKIAKKNADLNQVRVKFAQADAFAYMRDMIRIGKQYDVVVLDPPKLIRGRAELEEGTKKHFDLNKLAMQLVKPGGLMLSCSCAGLLPEQEFFQIIRAAGKATGFNEDGTPRPPRTVQILSRHGAAADHPVVTHCPETEYFKSVWMRLL